MNFVFVNLYRYPKEEIVLLRGIDVECFVDIGFNGSVELKSKLSIAIGN